MLYTFDSLPSTNDTARDFAEKGEAAFTCVTALTQTAGRGRQGRPWSSPPGAGLYASLILRPSIPIEQYPMLSLLIGVATVSTLQTFTSLPVGLKWPNDVLVREHKIGGILCEASIASSPAASYVIAGLGLNVNTTQEDLPARPIFPAASLAILSGHPFDIHAIRTCWIDQVRHHLHQLELKGPTELISQWNAFDALAGRLLKATAPSTLPRIGINRGIDATGSLQLETDSGIVPLHAGEISLSPAETT